MKTQIESALWRGVGFVAAMALGLVPACSSGDDDVEGGHDGGVAEDGGHTEHDGGTTGPTGPTGPAAFTPPADHVEINFAIDDRANATYAAGELQWKGSFTYADTTRVLTHDATWGGGSGPYPTLFDDGPWNMGGHEAAGATAGDHVWSIAVWVAKPTADLMFEYGAQESSGGWIWKGSNGTFTVPAGATARIIAPGLVIAAHGDHDLRLALDTQALATGFTFDASTDDVKVKGVYWAWTEITCLDDGTQGDVTSGDGVYTFVLSQHVGPGTALKHTGLLNPGDSADFVFVVHGVEYKGTVEGITGNVPLTDGVSVATQAPGGAFIERPIGRREDGDRNTFALVPEPFTQPTGTAALSFSIDDSANKTYRAGDLQWKGSFTYEAATRLITHDPTWGGGAGPYPTLWDDGPWSLGGHEPAGATAGDHIWGITAFFASPEAEKMFEYGAQTSWGGWLWRGANGSFTVAAGSTAAVTATGLTIPAFGTTDLRLTLDTNALAAGFTFDPLTDDVKVKGSAWAWSEITCTDDASKGDATANDRVYTFVLGQHVGAGTDYPHTGLLNTGDRPEFVFVVHGVEYKGTVEGFTGNVPLTAGVTAATKPSGGSFTTQTIVRTEGGDFNTLVVVP